MNKYFDGMSNSTVTVTVYAVFRFRVKIAAKYM